jgi:tetratricopeptide (TPR) repeat protein
MRSTTSNRRKFLRVPLCSFLAVALLAQTSLIKAQSNGGHDRAADQTWDGKRIVMLKSFGDYYADGENGKPRLIEASGLGVNVVSVVDRVEGRHVWIKANGAGNAGVGWIEKDNVILLDDAIAHFTSLIGQDPNNWDAYFRRAESEHALNQRDAAIADYSAAIRLHPDEVFLYLRRGREYRILQASDKALADFDAAIKLKPQWAELYNMEAGIYSDGPDPRYRDPQKAIALIQHAIALDVQHPAYLTVLASAYAQAGELQKAVTTLEQALESPLFPPGYREGTTIQLQKYKEMLAAKKSERN